jgi:hypothetical protein
LGTQWQEVFSLLSIEVNLNIESIIENKVVLVVLAVAFVLLQELESLVTARLAPLLTF